LLDPVEALPEALCCLILQLLPADARLRCKEVSRGWRALLGRNATLWRVADLSAASGVARRSEPLLAALSDGGGLVELDVSGWEQLDVGALHAAVARNAATLRSLRAVGCTRGHGWRWTGASAAARLSLRGRAVRSRNSRPAPQGRKCARCCAPRPACTC